MDFFNYNYEYAHGMFTLNNIIGGINVLILTILLLLIGAFGLFVIRNPEKFNKMYKMAEGLSGVLPVQIVILFVCHYFFPNPFLKESWEYHFDDFLIFLLKIIIYIVFFICLVFAGKAIAEKTRVGSKFPLDIETGNKKNKTIFLLFLSISTIPLLFFTGFLSFYLIYANDWNFSYLPLIIIAAACVLSLFTIAPFLMIKFWQEGWGLILAVWLFLLLGSYSFLLDSFLRINKYDGAKLRKCLVSDSRVVFDYPKDPWWWLYRPNDMRITVKIKDSGQMTLCGINYQSFTNTDCIRVAQVGKWGFSVSVDTTKSKMKESGGKITHSSLFTSCIEIGRKSDYSEYFPYEINKVHDLIRYYDDISAVVDSWPDVPGSLNFVNGKGDIYKVKKSLE